MIVSKGYWVRCNQGGLSLDRYWRYGKLAVSRSLYEVTWPTLKEELMGIQGLKPPFQILIRDPNVVAIPLEASDALSFDNYKVNRDRVSFGDA